MDSVEVREAWSLQHPWIAFAFMVTLISAPFGACSDSESVSERTRLTLTEADELGAEVLLTEDDVASVAGFSDVVSAPMGDVSVFENPDQRGPCGALLPELPLEGASGRSFTGDRAFVLEVVAPWGPGVEEYLSAVVADARPGCDDFESGNGTGITQLVTDVDSVGLGDLGTSSVGWTSVISINGSDDYSGSLALRASDRVAFLQVLSADPVDRSQLEALARLAADRLPS
jgi:hypothetical protein